MIHQVEDEYSESQRLSCLAFEHFLKCPLSCNSGGVYKGRRLFARIENLSVLRRFESYRNRTGCPSDRAVSGGERERLLTWGGGVDFANYVAIVLGLRKVLWRPFFKLWEIQESPFLAFGGNLAIPGFFSDCKDVNVLEAAEHFFSSESRPNFDLLRVMNKVFRLGPRPRGQQAPSPSGV